MSCRHFRFLAIVQAFMDEYKLTPVESMRWTRYLGLSWGAFEADYFASVPGAWRLRFETHCSLDQQLYFGLGTSDLDPEFVQWVEENIVNR